MLREQLTILVLCSWLLMVAAPVDVRAQADPPAVEAVCGVVNALDYPLDVSDTFERGFDDFARQRDRFGGLHVGIDLAFRRYGEPVRAAARGRVTYSNAEGWDTEKGVVVIEHTFPDGSIAYSLYGHMEETDRFTFPLEGTCVERGTILGAIGDPSLSAPHLHFEFRDFLPNDGGPGYVTENPLLQGWYHPLDFIMRWRLQLEPGFVGAATFDEPPDLPPVRLDSGVFVIAREDSVAGFAPPNQLLWRVTTDGVVTGVAGLPNNQVIAHTDNGQVILLENGRYIALWQLDGLAAPFVKLAGGEILVFATLDGGLSARRPTGETVWTLSGGMTQAESVFHFAVHEETISFGARGAGRYHWRQVDAAGASLYEAELAANTRITANPMGGWLLLEGASLDRVVGGERWTIGSTGQLAGRSASMTADILGNVYIYLDDRESTLLSLDWEGQPRWRTTYPYPVDGIPPLLDTGNGCLLYVLGMDGWLSMFHTVDGQLMNEAQLYAGGSRTSNPASRLLAVDKVDQIQLGAGFLTVALLDGVALNSEIAASCRLG